MKFNYLSPEQLLANKIIPPDADVIDVCIAPCRALSCSPQELASLSQDELDRGYSLRMDSKRHAYFSSRILLRQALSAYLNYPAEKLSFKIGSHGKPYLGSPARSDSGSFRPAMYFNLSHSGDYIAIAFSSAAPIGIDIEKSREHFRGESLVRRFFHPDEFTEYKNLPKCDQQEFVFRRWTIREAFLKGLGDGLSISPDSFFVSVLDSGFCIKKGQKDYSSWHISSLFAPDSYYCSIAYQPALQMPPV